MQPDMPHYNHIKHHILAPVHRPMPPYPDSGVPGSIQGKPGQCLCFETEGGQKIDCPYVNSDDENAETSCNCDCELCKAGIIRDPLMFNVVNIETSIVKTLKLTLYGTSSDKDKTVEMKEGNRYAVTYITERGMVTSVGYLELISDSVPDKCTRYIGGANSMATVSSAYIGMDCSTEGHSDKRKIYIATIRFVQALEEGETPDIEEVKSMRERLQELLDAIENGELVFCDKKSCCDDGIDVQPIEPENPVDPDTGKYDDYTGIDTTSVAANSKKVYDIMDEIGSMIPETKQSEKFIPDSNMVLDDTKNLERMDVKLL